MIFEGYTNKRVIFENAEFSITDYLGASMLPNPALNYFDSIAWVPLTNSDIVSDRSMPSFSVCTIRTLLKIFNSGFNCVSSSLFYSNLQIYKKCYGLCNSSQRLYKEEKLNNISFLIWVSITYNIFHCKWKVLVSLLRKVWFCTISFYEIAMYPVSQTNKTSMDDTIGDWKKMFFGSETVNFVLLY